MRDSLQLHHYQTTKQFFAMKSLLFICISVWILMGLGACHSSRPYYNHAHRNWQAESSSFNEQEIAHTFFLLGGLGYADELPPAVSFLNEHLQQAGKHSSLILLGDNISPEGFPPVGSVARGKVENQLKSYLQVFKPFKGKIYYVPGDFEWMGGRSAISELETYIEGFLDRKKVFKPNKGCADPEVVEVSDELTVVFLDSRWYIQSGNARRDTLKGCKIKSHEDFKEEFAKIIDKYDDHSILVALHHPLKSNGTHAGYYPLLTHLMPPFFGSVGPTLHYLGISREDLHNAYYTEFINMIEEVTIETKNVVFVSGHERGLQYFAEKDHQYVVSGSAARPGYLKKNDEAEFLYQKPGFSKLIYYKDGSVWLEMWAAPWKGKPGRLIFRQQIQEKSLSVGNGEGAKASVADPELNLTERVSVADSIYAAGKGKRFWFGKLYRDAWTTSMPFPVLDLSKVYGGLKPIKKGGGKQTQSLRLQAPDGRQYVMRSVAKDVSPLTPEFIKNTVLQDAFQDLSATAHPFGAMVVPPLARAAGVYHTNPRFYYVPKQPALGDFSQSFGGELYLFEERPAKDRSGEANFGFSEKIVSFRSMNRELWDDHDNQVDQHAVLRARVFDILIGDWDRRSDNWRWATFDRKEGGTLYRPVPRDRDQVFVKIDGVIPWLASREWAVRNFQNFDEDIRDLPGLGFNARYFDRAYLNEMDRNDWLAMADSISDAVTDAVIDSAIHLWPEPIFALNGQDIIDKLKVRRLRLREFVSRLYDFLAKEVEVVGSDKREQFEVQRLEPNKTRVVVYSLSKKGKKKEKIYERTFLFPETREIRLFGLDDDDVFVIEGTAARGSLLRIIPGEGKDRITDNSRVGGGRRSLLYDDGREANEINRGKEMGLRLEDDPHVHEYNWRAFKYPTYLPLITPGFNPDDGWGLGGGITWTTHGFRKAPYKANQQVNAFFAFATGAAKVAYQGDFIDVLGRGDFWLEAEAFAPTFVINYFGLGNQTTYSDRNDEDFNFNRLRYARAVLYPAFKNASLSKRHTFTLGPRYEFTKAEQTEGRFAADPTSDLVARDFEPKHYAGLQLNYRLNAVDNELIPQRGLRMNVQAGWQADMAHTQRNYAYFSSDLSFYFTAYAGQFAATLASRIGGGANVGEYEFYQAQRLGRRTNLRGFRGERFAGDAMAFHNTDLRLKLGKISNKIMPFDIGLIGFFDYGRVWLEGENSNKWHQGYGGGLLISPYQLSMISMTYSISEEANFFELKFGFLF